MPDAQKVIAKVLGSHPYASDHSGGPGWRCRGDDCSASGVWDEEFDAHVAAEIDSALGGLTRQWSVTEQWEGRSNATFSDLEDADAFAASIVSNFWHRFAGVSGAAIAEPKPTIEHRWVGGWTPESADG